MEWLENQFRHDPLQITYLTANENLFEWLSKWHCRTVLASRRWVHPVYQLFHLRASPQPGCSAIYFCKLISAVTFRQQRLLPGGCQMNREQWRKLFSSSFFFFSIPRGIRRKSAWAHHTAAATAPQPSRAKFLKRSINEIIAGLETNVRRRFAKSFHAILALKYVWGVSSYLNTERSGGLPLSLADTLAAGGAGNRRHLLMDWCV